MVLKISEFWYCGLPKTDDKDKTDFFKDSKKMLFSKTSAFPLILLRFAGVVLKFCVARRMKDSFGAGEYFYERRWVRPHTVKRLPSTVKRTSKSAYGMPYIRFGWCWYAGRGSCANTARSAFCCAGGNLVQQLWGERNLQCAIFLLKGKTSFSVRIGIGIWEVRLNIVNRSTVH